MSQQAKWVVRYIIDWGFGDYPSFLIILLYTAILNQRHRAYLHVVMYGSMLILGWILQFGYAQPLLFNMFPSVMYNEADGVDNYQIFSCKFEFGLPSIQSFEMLSLFVYIVCDYIMHKQEQDQIISENTSKVCSIYFVAAIVTSMFFISLSCTFRTLQGINTFN